MVVTHRQRPHVFGQRVRMRERKVPWSQWGLRARRTWRSDCTSSAEILYSAGCRSTPDARAPSQRTCQDVRHFGLGRRHSGCPGTKSRRLMSLQEYTRMDAWVVDAFCRPGSSLKYTSHTGWYWPGVALCVWQFVQVVTGAALSIRLAQFANCDSITRFGRAKMVSRPSGVSIGHSDSSIGRKQPFAHESVPGGHTTGGLGGGLGGGRGGCVWVRWERKGVAKGRVAGTAAARRRRRRRWMPRWQWRRRRWR